LLSHQDKITPNSPLWPSPQLLSKCGVKQISIKDKLKRSELASFEAIGAPSDLIKLILRHYPDYLPNLILTGSYPNFKMALR
jgi:diaminopropionate ammonia-lyase